MHINPFKLERFFDKYEFKVKYLLSSSDCEGLTLSELIYMANPDNLGLWQNLRLGYTEASGHPLLRAEIARMYANIPENNIVVAAPEEAIFIAMQAFLSPQDHVIAIFPAYQSLYEIARSIGCKLSLWKIEESINGWQLDLDQLERSITPQTRLLVLNFPHNPTGYLPTRAEFDAIIQIARKHNLYIFSDEMYRLLEYDPALKLPAMCELYEKGISLSGLSKSMALPGLRMGWLAAQETSWAGKWLAIKDYTTICNSAPSEILAIIALQNQQKILNRNLEIIQTNLGYAEAFFNELSQFFSWSKPMAGSVAFPQWLGTESIEQFCQRLLDQLGVMLVPGSMFEYPGNHFRLGLGRKNFPQAIELVQQYLKIQV